MAVARTSQVLDGLQKRFDQLVFEVNSEGGVLSVKSFDRTFGFIDDTLVIISDMCGEKETALHDRDELLSLRGELNLLNEVLEKFGRCQSQARFLYPLFRDGPERESVECWNAVMAELEGAGDSARTLATDEWLQRLRKLNHEYETLSLRLDELVTEQQAKFARLYFCANEETLLILSETSADVGAVDRVQPFLRRLFGFSSAEHDDSGAVVSVTNDTGDVVDLVGGDPKTKLTPAKVETAGRPLAEWLDELGSAVRRSLVLHAVHAIYTRPGARFRDWAMQGPPAAVATAAQVLFTHKIEAVLKKIATRRKLSVVSLQSGALSPCSDDTHELKSLQLQLQMDVSDLAEWVVAGNRRQRVRRMLGILLAQRDIVDMLLEEGVSSKADIRWLSQRRWYVSEIKTGGIPAGDIDAKDLRFLADHPCDGTWYRIRMEVDHSSFDYYGECSTQQTILADGPETSRFAACVLHMLQSQYAGCIVTQEPPNPGAFGVVAPYPPHVLLADLARSVGKNWEVLQCTPDTPIATVAKCLKGAFACGVWLCFCNVDLLDPTVIALIHEGALSTRDALRTGAPSYQFEGKVVPVKSKTFALFGTLSGRPMGEVTQRSIAALQSLLSPVAVPLYSIRGLVCWHLQLHGLERYTSEVMSQGMGLFFERVSKHTELRRQASSGVFLVDEFLSALSQTLSVMEFAGARPAEVFSNAIYKSVMRQVSPDVWPDVHTLVRSCLGPDGVPSPEEQQPLLDSFHDTVTRYLQEHRMVPNPLFMVKCEQIYDALRCSPAVIIFGPAAAGKTTALRAVQHSSVPRVDCSHVFASAMQDVFGHTDAANDWMDGPVTHIFRHFASRPDHGGQDWLVIDGPVSADVAAALLSVVDAKTRTLTLETGEIIRARPSFRIIFEVASLDDIPPELRAVCPYVRFEDALIPSDHIHHYATDPHGFLTPFHRHVKSALDRLVPPIVEWAAGEARSDWNGDADPHRPGEALFPLNVGACVRNTFAVLNGFKNKRQTGRVGADHLSDGPGVEVVEPLVLFSVVWGFGAAMCSTPQSAADFSVFLRRLVVDANLEARFPPPTGDELGLVFDYMYDVEAREWLQWSLLYNVSKLSGTTVEGCGADGWVTTLDTWRAEWMLTHLADKGVPMLVCGDDGVGKKALLTHSLRHSDVMHCAGTGAKDLEAVAGTHLQKSREGVICLPDKLEKPLYLTLCDLELAQPTALDFAKQIRDNGGWYDTYTNTLLSVHDVAVAAVSGVQGLKRFTDRQLAQFFMFTVMEPEDDELVKRLSAVLHAIGSREGNARSAAKHSQSLAVMLAGVLTAVRQTFPTTARPRLCWPVSTLFAVARTLAAMPHVRTPHLPDVLRLAIHELTFHLSRKFPADGPERDAASQLIWGHVSKTFPDVTRDEIMRGRPFVLFTGIEELRDFQDPSVWTSVLADTAERAAVLHPTLNVGLGADLSEGLPPAESNVTDLLRALRDPGGHVLVLSGCLQAHVDEVRLATMLLDGNLFIPEFSVHHAAEHWRAFLKDVCMHAIVSANPDVVLVPEYVLTPSAAADISALVKGGELNGLFTQTDWVSITVLMGKHMRRRGEYLRGREHVRQIAAARTLEMLRFVAVCDPSSPTYKPSVGAIAAFRTKFASIELQEADSRLLVLKNLSSFGGQDVMRAAVGMFAVVRECFTNGAMRHSGMVDISPTAFALFVEVAGAAAASRLARKSESKGTYERGLAALEVYTAPSADDKDVAAVVQGRWRRMLAMCSEAEAGASGDCLLFAASVVWCGSIAASERPELMARFAAINQECGLPCAPRFDAVDYYLESRPAGQDPAVWRKGGLLGSTLQLFAVALESLPARRALCVADPHTFVIPYLRVRSAGVDGHVDVVRGPFSECVLERVSRALQTGGVVVLDGAAPSDLDRPWLASVIIGLAQTQSTSALRVGDREFPVHPGARLVLILKTAEFGGRLPTHVRVCATLLNLECEKSQVAEILCAEALDAAFPSDRPRRDEAARALEWNERKVAGAVPSGGGASAARWEQELPLLLRNVAAADKDYTELAMVLAELTEKVAGARLQFYDLGLCVADAFLSAAEFSHSQPCSQFTLEFFANALRDVVSMEDDAVDWEARMPDVAVKLTRYFFDRIAASSPHPSSSEVLGWLLVRHRDESEEEARAVQNLLTGQSPHTVPHPPASNPQPSWLLPQMSVDLNCLIKTPGAELQGAWEEISEHLDEYMQYYTTSQCNPISGAPSWHFPCDPIVNMVITRVLRPDLLLPLLRHYMESENGLGVARAQTTPDISSILQDSVLGCPPRTPLLVVTPAADVDDTFTRGVQQLAQNTKVEGKDQKPESMLRRTYFIAAAPSQRAMAVSLIRDACREGGWIVASNVMVSEEFAQAIDEIVSDIRNRAEEPHEHFRLILQTSATTLLPASLVRACTKLGLPRVAGLGGQLRSIVACMIEHFTTPGSAAGLSDPQRLQQYVQLLPCLAIYHALVVERCARGWVPGPGVVYGRDVLKGAVRALLRLINTHPPGQTPVDVVRHVTATIVYGARVSSAAAKAVLVRLSGRCIHTGCTGESYAFGSDPQHYVGGTQHAFLGWVQQLPDTPDTSPDVLELGDAWVAADDRRLGYEFCSEVHRLTRQPVSDLGTVIASIREGMPRQVLAPDAAFEWLPAPNTPVLRVLYPLMQQELHRFTSILATVNSDLQRLEAAQAADRSLTGALQQCAAQMRDGTVPHGWLDLSGMSPQSAPSLSVWLEWLRASVLYFHKWSGEGVQPSVLDISAFVDPFALLRAIVDQSADAESLSAAAMQLELEFIRAGSGNRGSPEARGADSSQGFFVSGLWVKNCGWSKETSCIVSPSTVRPCEQLPVAQIRAVQRLHPSGPVDAGPDTLRCVVYRDFGMQRPVGELHLPCGEPGSAFWSMQGVCVSTVPW
eukprot:TRINITY_DN7983_c3_g1_i1.p1 TRINITY_DN7983_c3_g1~~TRINITY_DN7983_c3_g1_i1.p1  ORF type:complete len:2942 (+),score=940.85 TRINITY_DN7983_c3_g1_i1:95-8827(+)